MSTKLIADRYELGHRLGSGGMSTVHLAVDTRLEREVAIKLLAEHLADDPAFVSRFQREALSAAKLIHPNIVQVYDSGLDEESGRHYIVMEHVAGPSCAAMLRDHGQLEVDHVVSIIEQACRGLDYAHRHGVIHRDVKPGNLLQTQDGTIKLADFGIALAIAQEQSRITQLGSVLGTAAYLSPEQSRGEQASATSDVYALGVVAYQLLAGRLPYEAPSLTELALIRESENPPPLEELNPSVPKSLAQAIEYALVVDPTVRYQSVAEMGTAIVAGSQGAAPAEAATQLLGEQTQMLPPRKPTRQPRRPRQARPAAGTAGRAPARVERAEQLPQKRERRRGRGLRRFLVLVLLAGAAGTAVVVAQEINQASKKTIKLRNVIETNVNDAVDSLEALISDNTQ